MQGFAATLTPESLSSLQSLVGDGIIKYIGMRICKAVAIWSASDV